MSYPGYPPPAGGYPPAAPGKRTWVDPLCKKMESGSLRPQRALPLGQGLKISLVLGGPR